jgi:uncharacterized protein (DUF1778 family)
MRSSLPAWMPPQTEGSILSGTIARMRKAAGSKSRRRSKLRLGRKTLVYFTDDERKLVDRAANLERRSISSFVANAAIAAADAVLVQKSSFKK